LVPWMLKSPLTTVLNEIFQNFPDIWFMRILG
jgi:hypothetical protein